jgi:predicted alpha/beta hydrolase family esterase
MVPGIGGSGSSHWQTLWERKYPEFSRVEQLDWDRPICADWMDKLHKAVEGAGAKPILVAHSLGCLLVAHWAAKSLSAAAGALLVAPADPDNICFPAQASGFWPVPMKRMEFPSILVASSDDPFCEMEFARRCAAGWGSRLMDAGPAGHINAEGGMGDWPFGFSLLQELLWMRRA